MVGKSFRNLATLTANESAKPPGPHRNLLHPKLLEPVHRLIVLAKGCIEVSVFALLLLSIRMLNQQPCREESVPDGIFRNSPLSLRRCWPGGLQGIFTVGGDLCRRAGRFPVHFSSDRRRLSLFFLCPVAVVVNLRCARNNWFSNLCHRCLPGLLR